ncbi:MAG: glycosyltransferase [Dysgonamonadaceae bacterium]|jgi:glycosyltransferase involved in cell wall biosynthesis|nr:glycosyltransferase [Dysgonamonadaceae bacterium]
MENSKQVSVIVPVYNGEKYVTQCIENLLHQTYKNLEIIVVNDGSTDRSAEIAEQYPVKIIHQENHGLSASRNVGINAAVGEFIHFLDVDDLINLEFYEKTVQAIVETDADMACCGFVFERYPFQTQKIEHKLLVSNLEDKLSLTNVANYGACWRYLFKTSFLKNTPVYFEEGRLVEDRVFSIQAVFYANRIVSVPDAVYFYKNRANSIMTTKNLSLISKRHQDRKHAQEFQRHFAKQNQFVLDRKLNHRRWQYKFLGIPVLTQRIYNEGKIKWYFLGIPIFQKKEMPKKEN